MSKGTRPDTRHAKQASDKDDGVDIVKVEIFDYAQEVAERVADLLEDQLRVYPYSQLGLATGTTMVPIYKEMVRRVQENRLNLAGVRTFNLDEYVGLDESNPNSFMAFMREHLFEPVGLPREHSYFPWPDFSRCPARYDDLIKECGGIDWQLLGIGHNGHIGFNEPQTPWDSKTHEVILTADTRRANRQAFGGEWLKVPQKAVTMGIGTIMHSRTIVLVALGKGKSAILAQALRGPMTLQVPASVLQRHPHTFVLCDRAAGTLLDR